MFTRRPLTVQWPWRISCRAPSLSPPPLAGAAAVVRLGSDVLDARNLEPGSLQGADGGLAARARPLDVHLDLLQALLEALARRRVGGHLGGERRRLARALEAGPAGGLPGDHVSDRVGQRHDRVVERSLDVRLSDRDVLFRLAPAPGASGRRGHYFLPT